MNQFMNLLGFSGDVPAGHGSATTAQPLILPPLPQLQLQPLRPLERLSSITSRLRVERSCSPLPRSASPPSRSHSRPPYPYDDQEPPPILGRRGHWRWIDDEPIWISPSFPSSASTALPARMSPEVHRDFPVSVQRAPSYLPAVGALAMPAQLGLMAGSIGDGPIEFAAPVQATYAAPLYSTPIPPRGSVSLAQASYVAPISGNLIEFAEAPVCAIAGTPISLAPVSYGDFYALPALSQANCARTISSTPVCLSGVSLAQATYAAPLFSTPVTLGGPLASAQGTYTQAMSTSVAPVSSTSIVLAGAASRQASYVPPICLKQSEAIAVHTSSMPVTLAGPVELLAKPTQSNAPSMSAKLPIASTSLSLPIPVLSATPSASYVPPIIQTHATFSSGNAMLPQPFPPSWNMALPQSAFPVACPIISSLPMSPPVPAMSLTPSASYVPPTIQSHATFLSASATLAQSPAIELQSSNPTLTYEEPFASHSLTRTLVSPGESSYAAPVMPVALAGPVELLATPSQGNAPPMFATAPITSSMPLLSATPPIMSSVQASIVSPIASYVPPTIQAQATFASGGAVYQPLAASRVLSMSDFSPRGANTNAAPVVGGGGSHSVEDLSDNTYIRQSSAAPDVNLGLRAFLVDRISQDKLPVTPRSARGGDGTVPAVASSPLSARRRREDRALPLAAAASPVQLRSASESDELATAVVSHSGDTTPAREPSPRDAKFSQVGDIGAWPSITWKSGSLLPSITWASDSLIQVKPEVPNAPSIAPASRPAAIAAGDIGAFPSAAWASGEIRSRSVPHERRSSALAGDIGTWPSGAWNSQRQSLVNNNIGKWPSDSSTKSPTNVGGNSWTYGSATWMIPSPAPGLQSVGVPMVGQFNALEVPIALDSQRPAAGGPPQVPLSVNPTYAGDIGSFPSAAWNASGSTVTAQIPTASVPSQVPRIAHPAYAGDIGAWSSAAWNSYQSAVSHHASSAGGTPQVPTGVNPTYAGDIGAWPSAAWNSSGSVVMTSIPRQVPTAVSPAGDISPWPPTAWNSAETAVVARQVPTAVRLAGDIGAWPSTSWNSGRSESPKKQSLVSNFTLPTGDVGAWSSAAFNSSHRQSSPDSRFWPGSIGDIFKSLDKGAPYMVGTLQPQAMEITAEVPALSQFELQTPQTNQAQEEAYTPCAVAVTIPACAYHALDVDRHDNSGRRPSDKNFSIE